jgi:hypothetical protein
MGTNVRGIDVPWNLNGCRLVYKSHRIRTRYVSGAALVDEG